MAPPSMVLRGPGAPSDLGRHPAAFLSTVTAVALIIWLWTCPPLLEGISRAAAKLGITPVPPATLLGVAALDVPDHLVEIEATAILD